MKGETGLQLLLKILVTIIRQYKLLHTHHATKNVLPKVSNEICTAKSSDVIQYSLHLTSQNHSK